MKIYSKTISFVIFLLKICFFSELAVAISNHIELLQSNGSIIESSNQPFNKLKALTYDNIRDQFVVSDTDRLNDTIFAVQLTEETDTDITPIIQDLPDDVLVSR